ncbi:MAG: DUF3567 family protein [Rubrivivax sp.]|jgi:hypothetical protein|nr:DUF3567 family protein [Rubrivivax sp.]
MQLLYNSDSYAVVQVDWPEAVDGDDRGAAPAAGRGGFEIVDKLARKEIFIEGVLAEHFKTGVQAIADSDPTPEAFDEFIGRYTALAQQGLVMH